MPNPLFRALVLAVVFSLGVGAGVGVERHWGQPSVLPTITGADATRVLRVIDGDSVVLPGAFGTEQGARLRDIDAPERGQPFAEAATREVERLCLGSEVGVSLPEQGDPTDRYGRLLVRLDCGGVDVNRHLVATGLAWVSDRYNTDAALPEVERDAERACRGLWRNPRPVPPWVKRGRARDGERRSARGLCRRSAGAAGQR